MRTACYGRYSSDLQRDTSLDDQISVARRYATSQGWEFLDQFIFTDAALSGASLDRPGIQRLREAVMCLPRPFDVLLVDDSSRISRDLADAVRLLQELKFAGIRVIYISQNIDSASEQAETLVAVHGVVDSLYRREMAKKIQRGLAGQLERGFATGSTTYGYRTVPVPDPSGKTDANGYPALLGKRVEIVPGEAQTVVAIFTWFADGLGVGRIVERLHRETDKGPRGASWREGAVKRILQNEKYVGKLIWGKKTFERRPGTRQQVQRPNPRDQWRIQVRPELRIVTDDLWERVQARRAEVRGRVVPSPSGRSLMRGRDAALHSRHLFSGFMRCAVCGNAIVTVCGGHGTPRYGCLQSWRNGTAVCTNRLTVRAKIVDAALLDRLKEELLAPSTLAYITSRLGDALNRHLDTRPRQLAEAHKAKETAAQRLQRLIDAIEQGISPASVAAAIVERRAELSRLDAAIQDLDDADAMTDRLAVMPGWVRQQLSELAALLTETPERVKAEFRRLGLRITMTPTTEAEPARPFYRANVEVPLSGLAGLHDLAASRSTGRSYRPGDIRSRFATNPEHKSDGSATGPSLHVASDSRSSECFAFSADFPPNQLGPGRRETSSRHAAPGA